MTLRRRIANAERIAARQPIPRLQPIEQRQRIVDALVRIALDSDKPTVVIAACKALIAAESQNQADEQRAILPDQPNRFIEIVDRLGIGPSPAGQ